MVAMVTGEATMQYLISQPNNILPEKDGLVNRSSENYLKTNWRARSITGSKSGG